jgi:hypothetical protein
VILRRVSPIVLGLGTVLGAAAYFTNRAIDDAVRRIAR